MNSNDTRQILIVDDEPEVRMLVAQILVQGGFEIREAGSAAEATQALHVFTPNLLITDYSLPDANGSVLMRRAKEIVPDLKCLMLTGWRELPGQLSSCSPADIVMSKPFSVQALEQETRRLLFGAPKEPRSSSSVAQEVR